MEIDANKIDQVAGYAHWEIDFTNGANFGWNWISEGNRRFAYTAAPTIR
jgi:hypothetical protein